MRIFLSSETQAPAGSTISKYRNIVFPILNSLMSENSEKYGNDVELLSIITTCVSQEFINDSNWKERNLYHKKDRSTDIRLNIDYAAFIVASSEKQYQMYLDNITSSIIQFALKHPKLDFKSEQLVLDFQDRLKKEER